MVNTQYSDRQRQIISGEIPLETVNGTTALALYKKAVANGDHDLAEKAQARIKQAKAEAEQRGYMRSKKARSLRRKGIYQWKQPKSNEYTEHHRRIIRGEIPLDEVHTKELISIHQKAHNNGDFVLAEMIFEQISHRREITAEKNKKSKIKTNKLHSIMGRFNDYDRSSPIPMWEQAILKGGIGLDEFTEEDAVKLVCILETAKDEENLKVAKLLLQYKRDPSALYITNNHWEAVNILEELFQLPIRRPWMWFEEEK